MRGCPPSADLANSESQRNDHQELKRKQREARKQHIRGLVATMRGVWVVKCIESGLEDVELGSGETLNE